MSRRLLFYIIFITVFAISILYSMKSLGEDSKPGGNKDKDHANKIESYDDLSPYPPIDWNVDYVKESETSKKELKSLYGMILEVYGNDEIEKDAKEKLILAQKSWEKYLDKEMDSEVALYPGGHPYFYMIAKCELELTQERISRLKYLLNDIYTTTLGSGAEINVNKRAKMMLDRLKYKKVR